jgi:uncharacterized protein
MPGYMTDERQPFLSLIYLILLALAGALVFVILAYIVGIAMYGQGILFESQEILSGNGNTGIGFLKLVQIASSIGMFVVPAVIFARIESSSPFSYLKLNTPVKPVFILLGIVIMFVSGPLLELTVSLNKEMHLPDFLNRLENWMRQKEDQLEKLTIQLLQMDNFRDLTINIFMIAVLPAIGEELIFRGCLQRIITNQTNNYHLGIWIAALVFSAIHVQFYGFIPRMLLGALFGYLFFWSKSIWVPILAHFINNGTTVLVAYFYQQKGKPLNELVNEETYQPDFLLYMGSFILTAFLLGYFYKRSLEFQKEDAGRLD